MKIDIPKLNDEVLEKICHHLIDTKYTRDMFYDTINKVAGVLACVNGDRCIGDLGGKRKPFEGFEKLIEDTFIPYMEEGFSSYDCQLIFTDSFYHCLTDLVLSGFLIGEGSDA